MGAYQVRACKDDQENACSNNARSVDDCSSRGLSLQRKSDTMLGGLNVMQRMAWVISRDLNLGFSGSSNSKSSPFRAGGSLNGSMDSVRGASILASASAPLIEGSASSNTASIASGSESSPAGSKGALTDNFLDTGKEPINQRPEGFDDIVGIGMGLNENGNGYKNSRYKKLSEKELTNQKGWFANLFNLRFHHRHILFSNHYHLPFASQPRYATNIGYGGELYHEHDLRGYNVNAQLTRNDTEDKVLVGVMSKEEYGLRNYGPYNLIRHNCQHWVNDVRAKFNSVKNNEREKNDCLDEYNKREQNHN